MLPPVDRRFGVGFGVRQSIKEFEADERLIVIRLFVNLREGVAGVIVEGHEVTCPCFSGAGPGPCRGLT